MLGIIKSFSKQKDMDSIFLGLKDGLKEQLITGLSGSSRAIMIASTYLVEKKPVMVVTYNLLQAQKLQEDLIQLVPENEVTLYAGNELIAVELSIASPELKAARIDVLNYWTNHSNGILIVPISGLRKIIPPKEMWKELQIPIKLGMDFTQEHILKLVQMGYNRVEMVTTPGEFSMRGGIVDIYPLTLDNPVRIELFDTEVDSIRAFSIDTQSSIEKLSQVSIGSFTEYPLLNEHFDFIQQRLQNDLSATLKKMKNDQIKETLVQTVQAEIEQLKQQIIPEQIFKYSSYIYQTKNSLIDYFPSNGIIIVDEATRVQEMNQALEKEEQEWYVSLLEEGKMVHDLRVSHTLNDLLQKSKQPIIYLSLFLKKINHAKPQNIVSVTCKQMQNFHGQLNLLKTEIERWEKGKYTVCLLAPNEERRKRLESILADYEINIMYAPNGQMVDKKVQIVEGNLNYGFELTTEKLVVITEEELFNKRTQKKQRPKKLANAERIKSYSELKVGDYVVHVNHGIGKYLGVETLEVGGVHKDYLNIRYQGTDQLFVPVDQIQLVQKYVGSESKEPKLYKLGGTEWKRVKKKVENSIADIADDLIKLYAQRQAAKGYAFSPDGQMQRDFESSFMYQETEDQIRTIEEIKKDMESDRPMDRLLCGDVGYGKTEVAIRAAFKAAADGKQVAILVPTTILAQQHYETMKERFSDFPINVSLLNRFRSKKAQTETLKGLKEGTVDIVVGTHRILSKDIKYKDLGLLIVDEEQRFGVTHKEKIKQLKTNIDVLTLTATPIPRTLHMSMLGVRDLSVIETPPVNRYPIQTYVMEHNPLIIREAMERELARDGQVYYLYNRVEDIERKANEISALVPDARVAYAHGQMAENELENVMLAFLSGEYDCLVSTTIIETGVDIPNVNTLIVHDADKMGLSQLYQLRGRVGRSNRVAYAYFTYQREKVLSEVAEKRLQAIKEFTELGSGFKIAMRDLSIRGAGNLLGAQQHGFIDSVGFDLYSQMLKEAIDERKFTDLNEPKEIKIDVDMDLKIDAYIPETYIKDSNQKIEMYKRFTSITTYSELLDLQAELEDRFGNYPKEVDYLFTITKIKVLANQAQATRIKQSKTEVTVYLSEKASKTIDGAKLVVFSSKFNRMLGVSMENQQIKITIHIKDVDTNKWLAVLEEIVNELPSMKIN